MKPSFLGMILNPKEQFRRMKQSPTIWGPLLIVILVMTILSTVILWISLEDSQMVEILPDGSKIVHSETKWTVLREHSISYIIGLSLTILVSSLFTWGLVKLFKGSGGFKSFLSLHVYLYVPKILSLLLTVIIYLTYGVTKDPTPITSITRILATEGSWKDYFGSIDLFTIWVCVLYIIGVSIISGLRRKVWIIGLIYAIIMSIPDLITRLFFD